jgi:PDZ domain-containing protein
MKKLILFITLSVYFISLSSIANDWLTSQQGINYRINSISKNDQSKSTQAIEAWQYQTIELFRQLDAMGIDYRNFNYQQKPWSKVSFGIVYSYDSQLGSKHGVPVSAVTPNGLMQKWGVHNGDIITRVNHQDLSNQLESNQDGQWKTAVTLTRTLKSLLDKQAVEIGILRGEKSLVLKGNVAGFEMPFLTISTTSNNSSRNYSSSEKQDYPVSSTDGSCGFVTTISRHKPKSELYEVEILSINGKNIRQRSKKKLAPGSYQIEIKEFIQSRRLSNNIPVRYRKKMIELTIEKNRQYTLSARFFEDLRNEREQYWQPEITENEKSCQ